MTRYTRKALAILVVAMALSMVPASAQQSDLMTLTIPFAFSVGDTTLPSGRYRVLQMSSATGTFVIRNARGGESVAVSSPSRLQERSVGRAKLVFRVYGGEYFLSQIWMPATDNGIELRTSHHEQRLASVGAPSRLVALISDRR